MRLSAILSGLMSAALIAVSMQAFSPAVPQRDMHRVHGRFFRKLANSGLTLGSDVVVEARANGGRLAPLPTVKFAVNQQQAKKGFVKPTVASTKLHGASSNEPTNQYINITNPPVIELASTLRTEGMNMRLTRDYPLSGNTGVLELNNANQRLLAPLKNTPRLSRDGGKGGYLNGQKLFIFCDTGSYAPPKSGSSNYKFLGFVSSSVAVDKGNRGFNSQPLVLQDRIGEWSDDVGRMRGFIPLTIGEFSYNLDMQGGGLRYAIWPMSSLLPLNRSHALIYAPIIYDNVDRARGTTDFTYGGATLLSISIPGDGGPVADRIVKQLFKETEVEWGTIGGIRSYGSSGFGGNDGKLYLFGKVVPTKGLMLARVNINKVADRGSYEYWTEGGQWSPGMQAPTSTAYFIKGNFMSGDMIYSPRHGTFIWVYMNGYSDNTIYYRYLLADKFILPSFAGGPKEGYVENIVKSKWSDEQVLFKTGAGPTGRSTYAGGVQQGYFEDDDVANGGKRMLLSWSMPTGDKPESSKSEYQFITAEVVWN